MGRRGDASCKYCGKAFRRRKAKQTYCCQSCRSRDYWSNQTSTPYSRYFIELVNRKGK